MSRKVINDWVIAASLFMVWCLTSVTCFGETPVGPLNRREIKIEYLTPTYLSISAEGINRLNFGTSRINRIVGDNSRYEAFLSDNGSDLFLISKVPAGETINMSVLTATLESVDLSIYVNKSQTTPVYANVNLAADNAENLHGKAEISKMIRQMHEGTAGKYYVIEEKRAIKIPAGSLVTKSPNSKPYLLLNQYVTYRYGNLVGAGFNLTGLDQKQALQITKEQLSTVFKNALAVSIDSGDIKPEEHSKSNKIFKITVFIVFSKEEGSNV